MGRRGRKWQGALFVGAALLAATPGDARRFTCDFDYDILRVGSDLDVKGVLNGQPLSLKRGVHPYPSGVFAIALSRCPPHVRSDEVQVLHNYEFSFESKGTISVLPFRDVEVKAGPVTVHVSGLQVGLNGTQVVTVAGQVFDTVLDMEIRSGVGSALGHSYDLTGCTAKVPMQGYFAYDSASGDTTFHIYEFSAPFMIESVGGIHGHFTVFGALTAIHFAASELRSEASSDSDVVDAEALPDAEVEGAVGPRGHWGGDVDAAGTGPRPARARRRGLVGTAAAAAGVAVAAVTIGFAAGRSVWPGPGSWRALRTWAPRGEPGTSVVLGQAPAVA